VPLRFACWMCRWRAGSRASSTLRLSTVVCAERVLQNTARNLRTRTSRRLNRTLVYPLRNSQAMMVEVTRR